MRRSPVGEGDRERCQQDAARHRQTERQPERTRRRVHSGSLADALFVDRGERVVVELRDEEAEPRPAMINGIDEVPAGVAPGARSGSAAPSQV